MNTTTVDSIVAANVRHYLGNSKPSDVAVWLNISVMDVIRLLDGDTSFTIDQLRNLTHHLGVPFLDLVFSPGQRWAQTLSTGLKEFDNYGDTDALASVLWGVLSSIMKRGVNSDSVHRADQLLIGALHTITTQVLDDENRAQVTSSIRDAVTPLNAD